MIKLISIIRVCPAYAAAWEGITDNGEYVYIRFRRGLLSAGIAPNAQVFWDRYIKKDIKVFNIIHASYVVGSMNWMDYEMLQELLGEVIQFPKWEIAA